MIVRPLPGEQLRYVEKISLRAGCELIIAHDASLHGPDGFWLNRPSAGSRPKQKRQIFFALVEYFASQGFWSHYVTHYWARLMERVRASCCGDWNACVNLPFMAAVLGTLMLACIGTYIKITMEVISRGFH